MGNCQAIDTAAMVMHHPSGRTERLYWPVTASEVMRMNPGHYVSIIIPSLPIDGAGRGEKDDGQNDKDREEARFTRVKLLHASETLITGHAYRLINSQEVMNVLRAKRCEKMRRRQQQPQRPQRQLAENSSQEDTGILTGQKDSMAEKNNQSSRGRALSMNSSVMKPKSWRPSLESIDEKAS